MDAKKILFDVMYLTVMYRWGSMDGHSYVMGVFDSEKQAKEVGIQERIYRGGKYEWIVYGYCRNKSFRDSKEVGIFKLAKSEEMVTHLDGEEIPPQEFIKKYKVAIGKVDREKLLKDIQYHEEVLNELRKRLQEEV